jgi:hypothetical protein
MNTVAGSESIKKKRESCRQRIARKHNRLHSCESPSATINWLANMLGTVPKQYNGTPMSRVRPQSLKAHRHSLQSRISLGNPTVFNSEIQTSAYDAKGCYKNSNEESGKREVERKLTSQHLAGRLDNAKNKRFAFFIMNNLRRQTGNLFIKRRYLLQIATSLTSFPHSNLCLTLSQSQARLKITNP